MKVLATSSDDSGDTGGNSEEVSDDSNPDDSNPDDSNPDDSNPDDSSLSGSKGASDDDDDAIDCSRDEELIDGECKKVTQVNGPGD